MKHDINELSDADAMAEKYRNYPRYAWADESVRMSADPPKYLLGATIFDADPYETLVDLERLKPKGARKLHWRDLGRKAQKSSLEIIARAPQTTSIVVASPLIGNKQERARRKCLQEMLAILESQHVSKLILESRKPALNSKDNDFLFYLRRSGMVSRIEIEHMDGQDNPRLLIPDQILGAYGDLTGAENAPDTLKRAWNAVGERVAVYEIAL